MAGGALQPTTTTKSISSRCRTADFWALWDDDETGQNAGRGQRYDASGSTVGSVFTFDGSNAQHTDAVLLGDGRVAPTWNNGEIHSAIIDTRDNANTSGVYGPDDWQVGTIGNDAFTATAAIVHGGAGNDTIQDGGGANDIFGDGGNDTIAISVWIPLNTLTEALASTL